jgi:hypothetical protein
MVRLPRDDATRDAMIATFFHEHGVYGVGGAADADRFLEEVVERSTGQLSRVVPVPFSPTFRDRDEQLKFYADQSKTTPTQFSPRALDRFARVATRASVQAGVSQRMREADRIRYGRDMTPIAPEYKARVDDARHRRETLERAYTAAEPNAPYAPDYANKTRAQFSRRDAVENAYDRTWVDAELAESAAYPFEAMREAVNAAA